MAREINRTYTDPLDVIWVTTANRIGFQIERSDDAYASKDAGSVITIGVGSTLDADDCLAQMIFHELCHALVQGPTRAGLADWGLCNRTDRDVPLERACLRVQAALASQVGLRLALAPTTDHRAFYDLLPPDPTEDATEPERDLVAAALKRADEPPFGPHLSRALAATRDIASILRPFSADLPSTLFGA